MGLVDRAKDRTEARQTLNRLHALRSQNFGGRESWDSAVLVLRTSLTREAAAQNSAVAMERLRYLAVAEPEPRLEHFLPPKAPPYQKPVELLEDMHRRWLAARSSWWQREQARFQEAALTQRLFEQVVDGERSARLAEQLRLWPRGTELAPSIADIEGIQAQVDAQNCAIESEISALATIIRDHGTAAEIDPVGGATDRPAADPVKVAKAIENVLELMIFDFKFEPNARVAYSPESRQAVVEYELPDVNVVPKAKAYK